MGQGPLFEEDWIKSVYRKRGEIVSRSIAGETILVPVNNRVADMKYIFSLNSVAAFLWDLIDGVNTLDGVLAGLSGRFDVGLEEAERDVMEFIEELVKAKLIEKVC